MANTQDNIRQLQMQLNRLGANLKVDGKLGYETTAAMKRNSTQKSLQTNNTSQSAKPAQSVSTSAASNSPITPFTSSRSNTPVATPRPATSFTPLANPPAQTRYSPLKTSGSLPAQPKPMQLKSMQAPIKPTDKELKSIVANSNFTDSEKRAYLRMIGMKDPTLATQMMTELGQKGLDVLGTVGRNRAKETVARKLVEQADLTGGQKTLYDRALDYEDPKINEEIIRDLYKRRPQGLPYREVAAPAAKTQVQGPQDYGIIEGIQVGNAVGLAGANPSAAVSRYENTATNVPTTVRLSAAQGMHNGLAEDPIGDAIDGQIPRYEQGDNFWERIKKLFEGMYWGTAKQAYEEEVGGTYNPYETLNPVEIAAHAQGDVLSYLGKSVNQAIKGDYAEERTGLGTALQIALDFTSVDKIADVRDFLQNFDPGQAARIQPSEHFFDALALLLPIASLKYTNEAADIVKGITKNGEGLFDAGKDAAKHGNDLVDAGQDVLAGVGKNFDNIKIIEGKVGGKIPVEDYNAFRSSSLKNPNSNSLTLGKYTNDSNSYIAKAGEDSSYFDMGSDFDKVMKQYDLSYDEMFDYFNKPALNDAISGGKIIRFSHDPRLYETGFIVDEWEYIKSAMKLTDADLIFKGGFWIVK